MTSSKPIEISQGSSLLHPFQTLSSHTHRASIAISPLSHTLYSPSKFSFSRFNLPKLSLLGAGPELVASADDGSTLTGAAAEASDRAPISMLKVREPQKSHELCYIAISNIIYVTKGNIILRRIICREKVISFCWIGALICVIGEGYVSVYDEEMVRREMIKSEMKKEPRDADIIHHDAADDDERNDHQQTQIEHPPNDVEQRSSYTLFSQTSSSAQYYTKYLSRIPLPHDSTPLDVLHLPTYLNKVLITTQQGHIDLLNVMSGQLIHRYGPFERKQDFGALDAAQLHILEERRDANKSKHALVTCMVPVPETLDVVALGFSDGQILIQDMYTNETLLSFDHSPGPVRAISFRADGVPTMVSGTTSGSVAVWSLTTGKLIEMYPQAHTDSIISLNFIAGTSLLVSSAEDNAIKLWEFETPQKMNLTFTAEGHAQPPSKVRFYGPSGKWVISAGKDRQIRVTDVKSGSSKSFRHKQHSNETIRERQPQGGRGKTVQAEATTSAQALTEALRPPIVDFDFSFLRERDWPNLITAHANDRTISTWIIRDATQGRGSMRGQRYDAPATTAAVSPCGNHVILGRKDGTMEKWNLQSCLKKGEFRRDSATNGRGGKHSDRQTPLVNMNQETQLQKNKRKKKVDSSKPAHDTAINAALIDHLNQYVFSVGFDGKLRVWSLSSLELKHEHDFGMPISKIVKSRNSNMIALAFADFSIRILDGESFKVIRHLKGHTFVVNDIAFSSDSRFLYTCANDNYLIVWDIISSDKVEWLELPQPATSVDVDSKDMYVVTAHSGSVGLSMWINKLTFGVGTLRQVTSPVRVSLPQMGDSFHNDEDEEARSLSAQNRRALNHDEEEDDALHISDHAFHQMLAQLHRDNQKGLLTQLGSEAEQKILSIRKLDVLRERAKVFDSKEVDVLKEQIPFFLDTEANEFLETKFVNDDKMKVKQNGVEGGMNPEHNEDPMRSNIRGRVDAPCTSRFIELIVEANETENYDKADQYLSEASPKLIDMSVRLLSAMDDYFEMLHFLAFIRHALHKGTCFDLTQSLLNLFLQVHDEVLIAGNDNMELFDMLEDIQHLQQGAWQKIDHKLKQNLFLCKHLSNLQ
mmetsp:Transcript_9932/g.37021  ORF Transcript_9932/g.37021 Transcript_9932/m.37021 type:complete len:1098 (-) Transcript_9932:61-3354(-)